MESYKKPQIYSNRGIWASQDIPDCSKDFICSHKRFITAITQSLVRYDFQLKFDWRTFQFHEWTNEEHHCGLFVVLQARPNSLKPQLNILSGSDGCRAVIMKQTNKVPLRNPRLVWFHFMALVVSPKYLAHLLNYLCLQWMDKAHANLCRKNTFGYYSIEMTDGGTDKDFRSDWVV